jgi:hypothetical protein
MLRSAHVHIFIAYLSCTFAFFTSDVFCLPESSQHKEKVLYWKYVYRLLSSLLSSSLQCSTESNLSIDSGERTSHMQY